MYIPPHYNNQNIEEIKGFLVNNSFAILINIVDNKPWGTHIPLELETDENGNDILVGHIAKANPQWKNFSDEAEVLCIFNGPHAYVSSSWYKEEEVPTWNYIAVHVYGNLKILNEEETMQSMHRLVDKYEKASKNPISLKNLSPKTLHQVKGVVGFKVEVSDIQATYKLSQTRTNDHHKIIYELEERPDPGSQGIAQHMKGKTS
ncbi:FMN-binding negative transcriptional regulator [Flagellimonas halotolerans]|uniref:FMN-binding negative transcriptional regulator n=1 Tax=Flagellimonas halotolerans TaxID=3112164 RepID=A0ABU6IR80_9FLAO|nr:MULTISPECIES: FMN-binding negative transcriptional regulator [unclassified Allomuricauda]MEC3965927.1 FMN-binding negative transcriptional regulator [Muricauda sp. SYSU M86414]MEC4265607.1 FMN-binding negative transcriptional regulator [Muricauda sp. SYSU M84420]